MRKFVNTQYFREAALDFQKNKGRYTLAPIGSKEWWEYWEEQERRCLFGYTVGDITITGRHYFYLNFTRIQKTLGKGKTERKIEDFPSFWAIDYDWWWYKEIAWSGCSPEFLKYLQLSKDPIYLGGARHLSCLKTRRGGYSYKEGADGGYNYNFIPNSKNYFFAGLEQYLIVDGILNKAQVNLDWLNKHTDGFWLKNRQKRNSLMHQKASYIDNVDKQEKGTFSEIIGLVIDDPNKVRGKDGVKVTFEEAGSFPDLKAALDIIVPSVRAGSTLTGQITVFGTGGEEGSDIEGLDEIFNDPTTYDMLPFVNDWEDFEETECGVYIPCYYANPTHMDSDGNIDIEAAIADDDAERAKAKNAKDPKKIDRRIAEFSRTPTEALLRVSVNNFPVQEALYQRSRILRSREVQGSILHGDLIRTEKGVEFQVKPDNVARPLIKYPHNKNMDLTGCISIFYKPHIGLGGIPNDLYFITVDPFYDEDAKDTTSLGAVYVHKRKHPDTSPLQECIVACYVARPNSMNTFYENLFKLADFYNCKIQSEIGGGGKGIYDYAKARKLLHKLEFQPVNINNQEIAKIQKNRTYFMNMTTDDKIQGLTYFRDWLCTPVGFSEDGNELWNIHFIFDLGLLEEIIKFNPKKNADRISSMVLAQYMYREKFRIEKQTKKRKRVVDNFQDGRRVPLMRIKDGEVII